MTNNNLENYEKHCNVGTVNSVTDLLTYIDSDTLYTGEIGNGENNKISFIMTIVNNIRFILTSDGTLCKYNDLTSTKAVTFKSSNKKVATVTSKGKVTAKKAGKVTITATCKDAKGKKAKFTVTVKAAPAPAKVVTPETVKPVVKDNTAEYTGLVANADKYVLTRGKQTVEISAAQVKEALGYIADPAAGFKAWESKENFTLGVLSATGKGATKTATIKGTSNYDGKYTATVTKVSDTEYAVVAKSEKGQNHNIKVTVAKDGTVTATSAKYVVTSDKNATNIVVKDAAGKVIASATAKDGKYTVKLPADKAKDLTITQYVAK